MAGSNSLNKIVFHLKHLHESEQIDEDAISLEEAYDSLLDAYQEARELTLDERKSSTTHIIGQ